MVIGIGALASLGLALPTGLAFGYGYGYGVRQGYSAFKPPSKTANDLKLSPNPVTGSLGAGLQSAEERTDVKTPVGTLTPEPSLAMESAKVVEPAPQKSGYNPDEWLFSKVPGSAPVRKSEIKTHEQFVTYMKKGIHPDGSGAGYHTRAKLYSKKKLAHR